VLRQRAQQLQVTQTPPASNHERSLFQRRLARGDGCLRFYGRAEELATRAVDRAGALPSGGSIGHGWDWQNRPVCEVSQQIQNQFEYVIGDRMPTHSRRCWQNPIPVSNQQEIALPETYTEEYRD